MGLISRVPSAPYQDGETLAGADLEGDFNTIYTEFNGSIGESNIEDDAISTAKIQDGAVTQAKLDGTLVAAVADNAVTTAKILDGAVTTPKLAANAVTQAKIALGSATGRIVTFSHTAVTLSTSFTTVASTVNYLTSTTVAGPIIIMVSAGFIMDTSTGEVSLTYQLLKNADSILGAGNVETLDLNANIEQTLFPFTRVYVDPSPSANTFISYYFQAKFTQVSGSGASASVKDISFALMELRS